MNASIKRKRIHKLQQKMQTGNTDACLLILSRDIFYYSGTAQPSILIVTPDDFCLMVRRAHDFVEQETFLPHEKILNGGDFAKARQWLRDKGIDGGKIGLELDIIPAALYLKIKNLFASFSIIDISVPILEQRMIKDDSEIESIREACRIMDLGHKRVLQTLRPGMTELDLAAEIEYVHRKSGHEGVLAMRHFDFYISRGPLSSGANLFRVSGFADTVTGTGLSPAVPAGPSNRVIQKGDIIITDIPTCHKGYHCDQTRTYVAGRPSDTVVTMFDTLKQLSDEAIVRMKPDISCESVFKFVTAKAEKTGMLDFFLGVAPRKASFIGHGIGLDANEPPVIRKGAKNCFQENMVLTVEMHMTCPGQGVVKLEDMVLIGKNECRVLSLTPKQLFRV